LICLTLKPLHGQRAVGSKAVEKQFALMTDVKKSLSFLSWSFKLALTSDTRLLVRHATNLSGASSLFPTVMRRQPVIVVRIWCDEQSQQIDSRDDKTRDDEVLPVDLCEHGEAHATVKVTLKLERSGRTRVGGIATSTRSSRVRKGR
jgi:hypothetical protein